MLIFSYTCQYAIKACIVLATERKKIGIIDISEQIGTPTYFTSKILQQLTKKQLISSGKGKGGGFYLTDEQFESLTIQDIYENFEGKEVLTSCLLGLKHCSGENPCPIHHLAVAVREKVLIMFQYKIKDLKDLGSVFQIMSQPPELL
ncbi:Rrf2 family transcriptional regulator [Chryseobacterium sp. Ch-15]|uniref:Rrf2 family transcriptional regulator n=1 Tax=Chryseobacterium muglaense TaxID=2893752 RepID=A0A9Q3USY1_9FLAO|nr:Rrf2 family transcriptional regulator [Chryseobacterium muglaense]MBD3906334.1 Rrf2 family transcriptional regulator [Chryseobacterium muglaense]MCC9033101.1 Rrf2 family transcriptional regulator [Chryseobacterium muglaense]MCM2556032.1 Rrf2 family transcriptional regulator [Chryseobacterium muglaense]